MRKVMLDFVNGFLCQLGFGAYVYMCDHRGCKWCRECHIRL